MKKLRLYIDTSVLGGNFDTYGLQLDRNNFTGGGDW